MTLKDELDQRLATSRQTASADVIASFQAGVDELVEQGIAARAITQGDIAPDFELPNSQGRLVRLSTILSRGPVVLSFYRGGWCPYCNLELRAYQRALPAIRELGASLLAVSPEPPDASLSTAEKNALEFEVLSDIDGDAARSYRLLFDLSDELKKTYLKIGNDLSVRNADGQWHLPIPATYVIGSDGRVSLAYVDPEYRNRLEPAEIVAALERMRVSGSD